MYIELCALFIAKNFTDAINLKFTFGSVRYLSPSLSRSLIISQTQNGCVSLFAEHGGLECFGSCSILRVEDSVLSGSTLNESGIL